MYSTWQEFRDALVAYGADPLQHSVVGWIALFVSYRSL
jgi:hypothetical protein